MAKMVVNRDEVVLMRSALLHKRNHLLDDLELCVRRRGLQRLKELALTGDAPYADRFLREQPKLDELGVDLPPEKAPE